MGTWGHQFDQNDDAVDFLMDLADEPSWEKVEVAMATYLASLDDFEFDMAYSAAEVVAAAIGYPAKPAGEKMGVEADAEPYLPFDWPQIVNWAQANKSLAAGLVPLARAVADALPGNEFLREEWAGAGALDAWLGGLHDLKQRLHAKQTDILED